jgi:hypothetical protein
MRLRLTILPLLSMIVIWAAALCASTPTYSILCTVLLSVLVPQAILVHKRFHRTFLY